MYEWIGYGVVCVVGLATVSFAMPAKWAGGLRQLILIGAALRLLGALLRYEVIVRAYGGAADALAYYSFGARFADLVHTGDGAAALSIVADMPQFWGTQFLQLVTGLVVTCVGPSIRGTSAVFALFGYAGVVLIARAAATGFPGAKIRPLITFMILWPSLWFWPSSIGKESVILLGLGIATSAIAGPRTSWARLSLGLGLAFLIRPHVAALLMIGLVAAEFLGQGGKLTAVRLGRLVALSLVAAFVVFNAAQQLGVGDPESAEAFVETRGGNTETGGSQIARPSGVTAIPMAFMNVLARPFLWEARNAMSLLSAVEMASLGWFAWYRRRSLKLVFQNWRRNRLLRTSVVFIVFLTLGYGLNYGNLGIIARQRVVIFPFIFIVLGAPLLTQKKRSPLTRAH